MCEGKCATAGHLIAGRLRKLPKKAQTICKESIYRYIYDPEIRHQENFVVCFARAHKRRLCKGIGMRTGSWIFPSEHRS
jgi:IS30 family transposase